MRARPCPFYPPERRSGSWRDLSTRPRPRRASRALARAARAPLRRALLSNTREFRPACGTRCDGGVCNSTRGRRTRAARASIPARSRAPARCFRKIARDSWRRRGGVAAVASPRDSRVSPRAPSDSSLPFVSLTPVSETTNRTAVRMGFIGSLPGKTPEATMASALYTDIKRWKAGIPGSVFCRCVARPAAVARPATVAARPPPPCRISRLSKNALSIAYRQGTFLAVFFRSFLIEPTTFS